MDMNTVEKAIKFAIDQEIQAAELYAKLLETSSDPKSKELFAELRDMEILHRKNLEAFDLNAFKQRHSSFPLLDLKLTDYLLEQPVKENLSFQETLILAAQREQKTYTMYLDMAAQFTSDEILLTLFELLAREEQLHKDQIESLYDDTVLSQN